MNRVNLRHILFALALLGSLLTVPCAWAAHKTMAVSPARAAGGWSVDWNVFTPLWSRAVKWVSNNGPSIDPNGTLPPGSKNGPSIDPDGSTSPSRPLGASSPHCLPGSGGCGS